MTSVLITSTEEELSLMDYIVVSAIKRLCDEGGIHYGTCIPTREGVANGTTNEITNEEVLKVFYPKEECTKANTNDYEDVYVTSYTFDIADAKSPCFAADIWAAFYRVYLSDVDPEYLDIFTQALWKMCEEVADEVFVIRNEHIPGFLEDTVLISLYEEEEHGLPVFKLKSGDYECALYASEHYPEIREEQAKREREENEARFPFNFSKCMTCEDNCSGCACYPVCEEYTEAAEELVEEIKPEEVIVLDDFGYMMTYVKDHPFATQDGYVHVHRLVAEENLKLINPDSPFFITSEDGKKYLAPGISIIHRDGDLNNNKFSNLKPICIGDREAVFRALNS